MCTVRRQGAETDDRKYGHTKLFRCSACVQLSLEASGRSWALEDGEMKK
jgi:hypothetical protein